MGIKFNCSNSDCRQRIEVDEALYGKSIHCPSCATTLQVPNSTTVKFNCSNPVCGQHIVVDVSETGRFVLCPACGKPSQIPGPPPKSVISGRTPLIETQKPLNQVSTRIRLAWLATPLGKLVFGWGVGAMLLIAIIGISYYRYWLAAPKELDALADQIYFNSSFCDVPLETPTGRSVYYAQNKRHQVEIYRIDLASLRRNQIAVIDGIEGRADQSAFTWIGWSPDEHYMAYFTKRDKTHQEIVLCGGIAGAVRSRFDMNVPGLIEKGVWLTTNSLVMLNFSHIIYLLNLEPEEKLGQSGKIGLNKLRKLGGHQDYLLIVDSDHSVAYIDENNLWSFSIPENRVYQLTHFTNGIIDSIDYSLRNHKFLISYKDTISGGRRCIYELESDFINGALPVKITGDACSRGQWIKGGDGYAYLEATNGANRLVFKYFDGQTNTNLFTDGNAQDYSVDSTGTKLCIVASKYHKELSLWEYDINNNSIRNLLPRDGSSALGEFVEPVEASIVQSDGRRLDYYFVPPTKLAPHKKYPVFFDENSANRYDQSVQFLANAGIFYVSPNRFGISDWSATPEPEDSLAVYAEMLKNPNVDPQRIYISGHSISTITACSLIGTNPEMWRGAILLSPVSLPRIPSNPAKYPSIFISIGTNDDMSMQKASETFVQDACRHLLPAQIDYEPAGHAYNTRQLMDSYEALVKFILRDY